MEDRQAYQNLLMLLKRGELLSGAIVRPQSARALIVCHHDQLPVTPEAELETARRERRVILHLRVERSEQGWLEVRTQREQESWICWGAEADAPPTPEWIYNLADGSKRMEIASARYKYGCAEVEA
jgi:hypothetical protein